MHWTKPGTNGWMGECIENTLQLAGRATTVMAQLKAESGHFSFDAALSRPELCL